VVRVSESPEAGESAEDLRVRTTLTQEKRPWLVRQKLVTAAAALPKNKRCRVNLESIELTLARLAASQASENARAKQECGAVSVAGPPRRSPRVLLFTLRFF
jgi:hypothetical protein